MNQILVQQYQFHAFIDVLQFFAKPYFYLDCLSVKISKVGRITNNKVTVKKIILLKTSCGVMAFSNNVQGQAEQYIWRVNHPTTVNSSSITKSSACF